MQRIIVTLIISVTAVVIASIAIVSCNAGSATNTEDNKTILNKKETNQAPGNNLIEFKVNGQLVKTSGWNIGRFGFKGNLSDWLNITTNMHDEKRAINVNLNGAVPGSYFFGEDGILKKQSHGSFFPDYMGDRTNSFSFTKGLFRITEVDTVKRIVNGIFWGTVKNLKGETLEITDGKIINGLIKPGVMKFE